jgi:hypothetical protein
MKPQALLLLALTACGGGGGSALTPAPGTGDTALTAQGAARAPQPTPTPGFFAPVLPSYILLEVVGGGARPQSGFASPPRDGYALAFDANGGLVRALRGPGRFPADAAYELDVLTTQPNLVQYPLTPYEPNVPFEKQGWILLGGRFDLTGQGVAFTNPWALRLKSVEQLPQGATIDAGSVPTPFLAWNTSTGALLGDFFDQTFPGLTFTATVPSTVMFTASGWPQSHCGNCWMILEH